jgi:hypothetical protein
MPLSEEMQVRLQSHKTGQNRNCSTKVEPTKAPNTLNLTAFSLTPMPLSEEL